MSYNINDITLGANVQYRYVDFDYVDNNNPLWSWGIDKFDTKWNFINYGFNFDYNVDNNTKVYARYAVVSREPTRTDMFGGNEDIRTAFQSIDPFNGPSNVSLTTNKAERSYDVEAGYVFTSDNIKANINAYYMMFKNERVLNGQYGLNGLPLHDTAEESHRTGIEVSADFNIIDNFYYAINASWSDNKITSATYKNKYHILTPAVTLNNDIYYKSKQLKVGIGEQYHSKMYLDQDNKYEIPEYLTFNVYANYRYKNIEIGGHVNNILNKVNYYNAAEGANGILWFRESGTNFYGDVKFYF